MSTSTVENIQQIPQASPAATSVLRVDQPSMLAPMPSVEQMRREIADITCQMQSVYFSPDLHLKKCVNKETGTKQELIQPNFNMEQTFDKNYNALEILENSNNEDGMVIPKQPTTISSTPREIQISEEFEIDGKRYRQTYQKRVVLERQTTRDIFLLPASASESMSPHIPRTSIEYTSPHFKQFVCSGDPHNETINTYQRPHLDVEIVNQGEENNHKKSVLKPDDTSKEVSTELADEVHGCLPESRELPVPVGTKNTPQEGVSKNKKKFTVREIAMVVRKHINTTFGRSRSPRTRQTDADNTDCSHTNAILPVNLKNQCCLNEFQTGKTELLGYMFQFGVWDNSAPVLDPRLPIASVKPADGEKPGLVVPAPAEWHHAEIGTNAFSVGKQEPLVRGRIVACLQRFTQNSAVSGKALHRSTYVQQTRLIRQRNKVELDDNSPVNHDPNCDSEQRFLQSTVNRKSGIDMPPGMLPCEEHSEKKSPIGEEYKFPRCGNERLQLLQSLCPAAAAATILFGHPNTSDLDESDDASSGSEQENTQIGTEKCIVKASSWCSPALIAQDMSKYLVFNQELQNEGSDKKGLQHTAVPQLLLKAGTFEGLILYALHFLQSGDKDMLMDRLFPQMFRLMYPTFTTADQVIEKLINFYVAFAPVEPGCQSTNWSDSLSAASFLVTLAKELPPACLTARLVLRLARFARLLILDGQQSLNTTDDTLRQEDVLSHKSLAEKLLDGLPLLSASAQLHERVKFRRMTMPHSVRNEKYSSKDGENKGPGKDKTISCTETKLQRNKLSDSNEIPIGGHSENENCRPTNLACAIGRTKAFLLTDPVVIAKELTKMEEEKFAGIDFQELLHIDRLQRGETPTLGICVEHFNRVTLWARSQLLFYGPKLDIPAETAEASLGDDVNHAENKSVLEQQSRNPVNSRNASLDDHAPSYCIPARRCHQKPSKDSLVVHINLIFNQMCEVLKQLKALRNFSSFLAILLAIQDVPESLLFKRSRILLHNFLSYMQPPTFSEYRRDLESAPLPYLPYLGLIFQQLIHLDAGNTLYIADAQQNANDRNFSEIDKPPNIDETFKKQDDKFINIWRCWKHYLILGYFVKRKEDPENSHHRFESNEKARDILNRLEDRMTDTVLNDAKQQLLNRKAK